MRDKLTEMFDRMMKALFREQGANLEINILASEEAQDFMEAHASVLDSSFRQVEMSEAMRKRLQRSDYIFSGLKTFHELNEAFPSLLDEHGNRKTFERFLNDVRKIDETYNWGYLRAEYNFVQASATMAAKWERFAEEGDRYNLQYRTAGDGKVRPEHAELHGVTRPMADPFWEEYFPPNGWNCRCTVVQVRKSKYPETPYDEAMALGESALTTHTPSKGAGIVIWPKGNLNWPSFRTTSYAPPAKYCKNAPETGKNPHGPSNVSIICMKWSRYFKRKWKRT